MRTDVLASLEPSSKSAYIRTWARFAGFMKSTFGVSPHHASVGQVELFVVQLHNEGLASKTIRQNLSHLTFQFQLQQKEPPTSSFNISKLLMSYSKSDPPPSIRLPITSNILLQMIDALQVMPYTNFERILLTALFTLMYQALLRISEVAPSPRTNHHLRPTQIILKKNSPNLTLRFLTFKFSKPGTVPLQIPYAQDKTCAVTAYTNYLAVRPKSSTSAFIRQDRTPINPKFVTKHIRSVLQFLGHNSSDFSNHSFRIGKATDMSRRGFTDTQICLAGRWSSAAFRKYIKPQILRFQN